VIFVNLIDTELQEKIANLKLLDTNVADALRLLLEDGPTNLQDDLSDWSTKELNRKHMLFYQGQQYIPKDDNLRRQLLKQFHYLITTGHPEELATYIDKGCATCQQFKINRNLCTLLAPTEST